MTGYTISSNLRSWVAVDPDRTRRRFLEGRDASDGQVIGRVGVTSEERLPDRVARARRAQEAWGGLGPGERSAALSVLRDMIVLRAPLIADTIARSLGKPRTEALDWDVAAAVAALDAAMAEAPVLLADLPLPLPSRLGPGKTATLRFLPRGVVLVIAPMGLPFGRAMGPAAAALAAGNAVILKPSSAVPMVGELLERILDDAFRSRPGLAQVVHGPGRLGHLLATAPGVDFVAFSGTASVARSLQEDLAPLMRPSLVEPGGGATLVICEDAPMDRAARAAVYGSFACGGLLGASAKRVLVHASVLGRFLERVLRAIRELRLGPGTAPGTDIGPLPHPGAVERLREQIQDALTRGARLETGGLPEGGDGRAWPPTVLSRVHGAMRIMLEDTAGPVLALQTFRDDESAVRMAHEGRPMAEASVFTLDPDRGRHLALRLRAPTVLVNEVLPEPRLLGLPGLSARPGPGLPPGRRFGRDDLRVYTETRMLLVDGGGCPDEPSWFPYGEVPAEGVRSRFPRP